MINTTTKIHHKKSTMQRQTKTHVDKKNRLYKPNLEKQKWEKLWLQVDSVEWYLVLDITKIII